MRTSTRNQHTSFTKPLYYRIKVYGELETNWNDYFTNLHISSEKGTTTIEGMVSDQSQLHGILNKIRNLNLPILLVESLEKTDEANSKKLE